MRYILALFVFLLSVSQALACPMLKDIKLEQIKSAKAVFVAEVVGYEVIPFNRDKRVLEHSLFKLQVKRVISGDLKEGQSLKLYWLNSTFGQPEKFSSERRLIFSSSGERNISGYEFQHDRVMQDICSPPFIFSYSEKNLRLVERALKGLLDSEEGSALRADSMRFLGE